MKYASLSLLFAVLALGACTGPVIMGGDAAVIYATNPDQPPGADPSLQIPPHESWCYETMGDPQCYARPQIGAANRLINVDPPSRYPLDAAAYRDAVMGKVPATAGPVILQPAPIVPAPVQQITIEKTTVIKDESTATDAADVQIAPREISP